MERSRSFTCVGNSGHSRGGSLLIITAERTAQTTALHSLHKGYNTLHLTLNIFPASVVTYHDFWLHSISRRSCTDLQHANSFVENHESLLESNKSCQCAHLLALHRFDYMWVETIDLLNRQSGMEHTCTYTYYTIISYQVLSMLLHTRTHTCRNSINL